MNPHGHVSASGAQTSLAPAIRAAPIPLASVPRRRYLLSVRRLPPPAGRGAQRVRARPRGAPCRPARRRRGGAWLRLGGPRGRTSSTGARTGTPLGKPREDGDRPGRGALRRCGRGGGRWSEEPRLRPPGRQEGGRAAPPRTVRVSRLQSEPRAEGSARSGDGGEAGCGGARVLSAPRRVRVAWRSAQLKLAGAPSERSLCRRRPRRGRRAGGGHRGAWGEGAVERGAWGRAAAARHRGGGRGSRAPPPVPTAPAAEPPPSARPPLRALAPASRSGSQLRPPGPAHVTRFPAPGTGARVPCPPGCRSPSRLAGARLAAQGCAGRGVTERGPGNPFPVLSASVRVSPWERPGEAVGSDWTAAGRRRMVLPR